MTNHVQPKHERRQWLTRVGRYIMLGGVSVLSLNLLARSLRGGCIQLTSPCQTCGLFQRCVLPRAEDSRQTQDEASTS